MSQETKAVEVKAKVQRVEANWDIDMKDGKLVITSTIEMDMNSQDTLDILNGLKLSESGKSYCVVATPTPKDFSDSFKGNMLLNIPVKAMMVLKQYVAQNVKKSAK